MIVFDEERRRVEDPDTGEYLTSELRDRETGEVWYTIHACDGAGLVTGLVVYEPWGPDGAAGATRIRYRLKEAFVPAKPFAAPRHLHGADPLIARLERFVTERSRLHDPSVAASFVDERGS